MWRHAVRLEGMRTFAEKPYLEILVQGLRIEQGTLTLTETYIISV
jgi:hypothetical protein